MDDQMLIDRLRSDLRAERDRRDAAPDWLIEAGRRRWHRRRARRVGAGAVVAAVVLVGAGIVAAGGGTDEGSVDAGPAGPGPTDAVIESTTSTTTPVTIGSTTAPGTTTTIGGPLPTGPPSQTADAAARDGIVPAIAELPFPLRVSVEAETATPEGTWVISRPSDRLNDPTTECGLGDTDGIYAVDWICPLDADEVLLIGSGGILRAYPMAQISPSWLLATDDAILGGRVGDGGEPYSSLFRIDLDTLELTGIIYAAPDGSTPTIGQDAMVPSTAASWRLAPAGADREDVLHSGGPGTPVVSAINGDLHADVPAIETLLAG